MNREVSLARARMIKLYPFFGYLALSTEISMVDNDSGILTAGVDGRHMFINEKFLLSLSQEKRVSLIAHEVMHLALLHVMRRKWRKPIKWNIAADVIVNETLIEQGLLLPTDDIRHSVTAKTIQLNFGVRIPNINNTTAEQVYNLLPDRADLDIGLDLTNEDSEAYSDLSTSTGGNVFGPSIQIPDREYWKNALASAANYVKKNSYGRLPAWLEREIGFSSPRMDWRTLMDYFTGTLVSERRTYRTPSRRHIWRDVVLPRDDVAKLFLAVVIDASGSITAKQLNNFMGEVIGILESGDTVIQLYVHDVEITEKMIVNQASELPTKVKGSGGTSFIPTTNDIEESYPRPDGVIWITDGWGSYPENEPSIPVLWVLTRQSDNPPYGWTAFMDE